jgi:hypothetical protein
MNLKSKELAELIDRILCLYSRQYKHMDFEIEGLPKISDRADREKPEDCPCIKLNNAIVFETLSTYGHGGANRSSEMVVVNGKFEGDKFYFNSAIKIYGKLLNHIYSAEITSIEPQIDTETESRKE